MMVNSRPFNSTVISAPCAGMRAIKTTGKAGGLLYAYKTPLPAALKAHESLPPAPPSLATPKGVLFLFALFVRLTRKRVYDFAHC